MCDINININLPLEAMRKKNRMNDVIIKKVISFGFFLEKEQNAVTVCV